MAGDKPQIDEKLAADAATLTLRGDWTASYASQLAALSDMAPTGLRDVTIDVSGVRRLDTFGAWAIETLRRSADATGEEARVVGLNDKSAAILGQMRPLTLTQGPIQRKPLFANIESLGRRAEEGVADVFSVVAMIGQLTIGLLNTLRIPRSLRMKSIVHHMDRVGVRAVPIIALITFLIGCIIAQQGLFYFRKFGATDYVVNLVVILVLREIGVLLVTIMVAGRSGSSYATELGSMKMREEIDALRTMGLNPVDLLVLPRVIALVVTAPMLTFVGIVSALYGAGLVVWLSGDMNPSIYLAHLKDAATFSDFEVGMIKAPIMALVIGVVAAVEGLKVQESSESLGLGATASVVKAIFLVIVLDGLFAVLFTSLGM